MMIPMMAPAPRPLSFSPPLFEGVAGAVVGVIVDGGMFATAYDVKCLIFILQTQEKLPISSPGVHGVPSALAKLLSAAPLV